MFVIMYSSNLLCFMLLATKFSIRRQVQFYRQQEVNNINMYKPLLDSITIHTYGSSGTNRWRGYAVESTKCIYDQKASVTIQFVKGVMRTLQYNSSKKYRINLTIYIGNILVLCVFKQNIVRKINNFAKQKLRWVYLMYLSKMLYDTQVRAYVNVKLFLRKT